jgi:hypothetical protein
MRLDCHEIEEYFSDYLENSLEGESLAQVRQHLKECPACLHLLNEIKATLSLCEVMPQLDPPARLIEQILVQTTGKYQSWGLWEYFRDLFRPLYSSPRFATGAFLAAVSFGFVLNAMGFSFARLSQMKLSDFTPAAIAQGFQRTVYLTYDNSVRRLNDLKILYEIQTRIDELRTQASNQPAKEKEKPDAKKEEGKPQSSASAIESMVAMLCGPQGAFLPEEKAAPEVEKC